MAPSCKIRSSEASRGAACGLLDALPPDAFAHVCALLPLPTLGRLAATSRQTERAVDDATASVSGLLREARLPTGCHNLAQTCVALHCTVAHVRKLPGYKPSGGSRITLVGVLEGLRSSKGGWECVRNELHAMRARSEKERALADERDAKRRARLARLDAWFVGVAEASSAARTNGHARVDVERALEGKDVRTNAEKKWGALCTVSDQTGRVVYPSVAMGHGEGVRSFAEWCDWFHGTRFAREARVQVPKCVETFARSDVLNAHPFGSVTTVLIAFDARARHAVACEEEVQLYFASRRLHVPDTTHVRSCRRHFWETSFTGCATGLEAAEEIKRSTVTALYEAEKQQMILAQQLMQQGQTSKFEPKQTPFISLELEFVPTMRIGEAWSSPPSAAPSFESVVASPARSPSPLTSLSDDDADDVLMAMMNEYG